MRLRPGRDDDLEVLYRIHRDALGPYVEATWGWDEPSQAGRFRERFDPETVQVIEVAGDVVGFLIVDECEDRLALSTIEIAPAHQRKGIGTSLIRDLLERAARRHVPVDLRVLRCNPAIRLYARMGFVVVGETGTHVEMRASPEEPGVFRGRR